MFHRGTIRETHARNKLTLDFDGHPPKFTKLNESIHKLGIIPTAIYYAKSSSLKHWHVVVFMKNEIPHLAVLFCELWLGSDRIRALCDYERLVHEKRTDKYAKILFEQKLPCETAVST